MSYATIDDVFARFPPINTMVGTLTNEVTSLQVSSTYIADAESIVNAYLGAKYATPLSNEPILTSITCDLAIFRLCEDRLPRVPDFATTRYTNATSLLAMLRDGQMILSNSQTLIESGDQEAWSSNSNFHPIFSPVLDPLYQKADEDQIEHEMDVRDYDYTDSGSC